MHRLKVVRVTVAVTVFTLLTFYFLDFTGLYPDSLRFIPKFQWVPALLAVTPAISFLFILSLCFGRFFCSAICPLGIFQDILIRISRKLPHRKKVKYAYRKPSSLIRYGILGLTLLSFLSGSTGLVLLLDPYSNFGRLMASFFRPFFMLLNNFLITLMHSIRLYPDSIYSVELTGLTWLSVGSALLIGIILILFTWRHGRLYCNVICPVGTFLGMMAKVSLFRLKLDKVECTGCGVCGTICKSECIDSENHTIDASRCVSCFNCLKVCRKGAIKYKFVLPSSVKRATPAYLSESRRQAIAFAGALATSLIARKAKAVAPIKNTDKNTDPAASRRVIMPPGADCISKFKLHCTACQLCITKCPSHVLQPATLQYGLDGILQPHMVYKKGYCNYNCTVCMDVCPTGALKSLPLADKRLTQVGIAQFRPELCIVPTQHTDCGACAEHCPTQAVRMVPYQDGLTIPALDPSLCIGCGGCEFICPVRPFQAIYIEGRDLHHRARVPAEADPFKEKVEEFGF